METKEENFYKRFPIGSDLTKLLELEKPAAAELFIPLVLTGPLENLFSRPKKSFRSQIVELGFRLSRSAEGSNPLTTSEKENCSLCSEILEALHAASLIIDDIEDGSQIRRGESSLHVKYGVPIALNAANWLYFWPLQKIKAWGLSPEKELSLYQIYHSTLLRAHYGQALDVGVKIDEVTQSQVKELCLSSMELKTGALMALAMKMGATMAEGCGERLKILDAFGHQFGIALQMFDDIGNLKGPKEFAAHYDKRFEDLLLRRPTWIWAVAAEEFSLVVFEKFKKAVNELPDTAPIKHFIAEHDLIGIAHKKATTYLKEAVSKITQELGSQPFDEEALVLLRSIAENLMTAYL